MTNTELGHRVHFEGSVRVRVAPGMQVQINPGAREAQPYLHRIFIIASQPRLVGEKECVALRNLDGSAFSPAYDLALLQVVDTALYNTAQWALPTTLQQALLPFAEQMNALKQQRQMGELTPVDFGVSRLDVLKSSLEALAAVFSFPAKVMYQADGDFSFAGSLGRHDGVCQPFGPELAAVLSLYPTRTGIAANKVDVLPVNGWLFIHHAVVERLLLEQSGLSAASGV